MRARSTRGWLPWWTAPDFRHASLRYLSVLTMQLDYALWPDRPELMHLHSLVWLGGLVAAATLFYRRVLGASWVAGLAALLYAVDDAHALPAAYLANRNAIVATGFGVLSLLCFARAALERIALVVLGQWTPVPSDYGSALVPESDAAIALRWSGVATLALVVALFAPLVRRDRVSRFFALGAALSLPPIAAVGPQDRLLFFVGLGSMGLLAQFVHASFSRGASLPARLVALALLGVHLLLAPPSALRWIAFQERASARMSAAVASVPADPALAAQDLILVNPPDYVYGVSAIPPMKRVAGQPSPRRLRALVAVPSALEATRVDARTLRVRLEGGFFSGPFTRYYRAEELRFAVGDRVELTGFAVEILCLNEVGDPNDLVYRFDVPLEDPSLRWLAWRDGVYVPWSPPAPGQTVRLPAPRGIFG